ncbi:MAG: helix-turn-helix transcriptional regulator [Myroides sp.]|nr:helix-turn-helix transcriptional regulator [Myroides sp.]
MDSIQIIKSNRIIPISFQTEKFTNKGILLSFCLNGEIKVKVNNVDIALTKGSLLTVFPQRIFSIQHLEEKGEYLCILFDLNVIEDLILPTNYQFLNELVRRPIIQLNEGNQKVFIDYYELLEQNTSLTDSVFYTDAIKYLLYSLIAHINRFYEQDEVNLKPSSKKETIIFRLYNLVHQDYLTEHSVAYYADKLKLTPKYLTTLVRKQTGKTVSAIINELLITQAQSYLIATDKPIYLIAEELKFLDSTSFCRYFKKHIGQSPLAYRQAHL